MLTPRTRAPYLIALVSVLLVGSCEPRSEDPRPNVLLITLDTTRRDHCSVYGYEHETTPNLARLAAQGVRFDRAYAPMATTGPTHASIFTSLYPATHRVIKNGLVLADELTTLAEILREDGYRTSGIAGSFVLHRKFGFGRGFEDYEDSFSFEGSTLRLDAWQGHDVEGRFDRRADETTRLAVEWLDAHGGAEEPFFLFVHYFDPHDPYVPPDGREQPFLHDAQGELGRLKALYDGEIAFTDAEVGKLLEALARFGLAGKTLVVVAADHGEGLMQHGHLLHGVHLYEEQVRVPLLMRLPGVIAGGRTFDEPVELIDVAPTVLDLVGASSVPADLQGRSLAEVLRGSERLDADRPVYLHRRHYEPGLVDSIAVDGEKFAVVVGGWKYIVGPDEGTEELYDLARDPGERRNVISRRPELAARLRANLDAWRRARERSTPLPEIAPEDRERLRAMGYVD